MVLLSGLGLPLVGFMVDWLSVMVLVGCFCKDRNYPFLSFSGFAVSWCWLVWSTFGRLLFSSSVERNHGIAAVGMDLSMVLQAEHSSG